jgi:hypothetical protein
MIIKMTARTNHDNIVKIPLVADLYESLLAKYRGVRYPPREMYLKQALTRLQKEFFFSALSDCKELNFFDAVILSS